MSAPGQEPSRDAQDDYGKGQAAPRNIVLERGGCRLHGWVSGPEDGPLVALTHGATMDHRMFDQQIAPLTTAGYRVLTWDIRGHGKSKPLGAPPGSVSDMTDDLLALLDQLGVTGPVCVGGQSLGGYVTQDLELRKPSRVAALVIVGSTCTTMPIPAWERWALRSSAWWFAPWPWGHLRRLTAKSTALHPAVRAYAYEAISQLSKREFLAVWRAVARAIKPRPGYRIEKPLLLTHGDQDRSGNIARMAPAWAARDPHARYVVIPEASHNANQDNHEFFNRVLLDFLTDAYPAGGAA